MTVVPNETSKWNSIRFSSRRLALTLAFCVLATVSAVAQQTSPPESSSTPQARAENDFFVYFYKDPQPDRLVGFLDKFEATPKDWNAYPRLVGFFAIVFRAHPDWIGRLLPANVDTKTAQTINAALQLAGQPTIPQNLRSRLASVGPDPQLGFEFANLPLRLEDLHVTLPTDLDILWGAFFASGDDRYVRMILDFFAKTANRSEGVAVDITKTVIAMAGGPKEILGEIKGKYGEAFGREMAYAVTAEMVLLANARRHPAVDKALTTYIAENPGTFATKSLTVLRQASNKGNNK